MRENVGIGVVIIRAVRDVLHSRRCRGDGHCVACRQCEYLAGCICCCSCAVICYGVDFIRMRLAVICPALYGRCDHQRLAALSNHQSTGHVGDVIVVGYVCISVLYHRRACCISRRTNLGNGTGHGHAGNRICALQAHRSSILPAIVRQGRSVVFPAAAVSGDLQQRLRDLQPAVRDVEGYGVVLVLRAEVVRGQAHGIGLVRVASAVYICSLSYGSCLFRSADLGYCQRRACGYADRIP